MPLRQDEFTRWAESLGHTVTPMEIPDSDWAWGLLVEDANTGVRSVVAQPEDDADRVTIQTSVVLMEAHRTALYDLCERDRDLFLAELRLTLHALRLDSAFVNEGDEDQPETVRITFSDQLLDENLNRASIDATLRASARALDTVSVLFARLAAYGE